jgi:acetyl esterase/lipase
MVKMWLTYPEVYLLTPQANGTAVIVAPGGGFRFLSWQTEGKEVAEWFAARGVTAFVLKYRVVDTGSTPEEFQKALAELFGAISAASSPQNSGEPGGDISRNPAMSDITLLGQEDGRQAIRIVRKRAAEWGVDPDKIGIMGFSAGGMVTMGPALQHDCESRPDFTGAIYTPLSFESVPDDAAPMFVLVAGDDNLAAQSSIQIWSKWKVAGKLAELHVYSKGGHGFGMIKRGLPVDNWIERMWDWMVAEGLVK